jgi:hypothetical protein
MLLCEHTNFASSVNRGLEVVLEQQSALKSLQFQLVDYFNTF